MTNRPLVAGTILIVSVQAVGASEFLECRFVSLAKPNSVTYQLTGDQLMVQSGKPDLDHSDLLAIDRKIVRNDKMGLIAVGDFSTYVLPTNGIRISNLGANVFMFDRSRGNAHVWNGRMYDGAVVSADGTCTSRKEG